MSFEPTSNLEEPRGLFAAWARLTTARPWVTLAVTAVMCGWAVYSSLQLQPATGVQDMLADDQPAAIAFGRIVQDYALIDELVLLVQLPEVEAEADPARLTAFAQRLERRLADEPMVRDVRYRPSASAQGFIEQVAVPHGLSYLDPAQHEAVLERLTPGAMVQQFEQNAAMLALPGPAASRLAKELIRDPLRLREFLVDKAKAFAAGGSTAGIQLMDDAEALISRDGRSLMIRVAGTEPASELNFTERFMPRVRAAIADADPRGLQVELTGGYAIAEHSAGQTKADMVRSCLGSIGLLVLVFLVIYRHPLAMVVLALPLNAAILIAFGLYVLISGRLTPVTAVAGAVLAGLGIDYCVHYLSHHEAERRAALRPGEPDPPASHQRPVARRTVAAIGPAMLAACVTSLIGFGVVMSSSVRSLREFSMLGVMGLALALLASITVLPALLVALGNSRIAPRGLSLTRIHFAGITHVAARFPKTGVALCAVVLAVASWLVWHGSHDETGWHAPLRFDSDLHALHPRPHPPLETQITIAEVFGAAPDSLLIYLEADDTPGLLRLAGEVDRRLDGEAGRTLGVAGKIGPATMLPTVEEDRRWSEARVERLLEDFDAAAEAGGFRPRAFSEYRDFLRTLLTTPPPTVQELRAFPELYEMVLPRGRDEPTQGLVLVTLDSQWTTAEQRDQDIRDLRSALADLPGATLTGISVIGYDTQVAIGQDVNLLLWLAGGAVLLWLVLFFRRPIDVVYALMPAAFGLLLLLACAAWQDWTLNAINLIALPLIVGIGVDDGIFLTSVTRGDRRTHASRSVIVEHLAASTHAVTMTSLTTGLAFGSLAFTSVPAVQTLGIFTAVGVGGAWVAAVAGLVPLLASRGR